MAALRLLVGFAVGLVAWLGVVLPAGAGRSDDTLRIASNVVPESLDSYFSTSREAIIVARHIFEPLLERDPATGDYRGLLARSWRWTATDTLEIDLRDDVVFHNGQKLTADDVVYTIRFVIDPTNKALSRQNVDWIASIDKTGDYQVRIQVHRPAPAALEYLSGPVVIYPAAYYSAVGPKGMSARPVGSGPYRVVDYQPGKLVRLERNEAYRSGGPIGRPAIKRIEFRLIPDLNTAIAELMAGGLDWVWRVPEDLIAPLKATPGLTVVGGETMRVAFLQINATEAAPVAALRDPRVRKAMILAIDRETIARTLVGEGARVLHTLCFPGQFGCTDDGATRYPYDPARARALLAEAGAAQGVVIELLTYRDRAQAEAVIGYLRAVGFDARLRTLEFAAMRQLRRDNRTSLEHRTWASYSLWDVSACISSFFNFSEEDTTRDPQLREWLAAADFSNDPLVRADNYRKVLFRVADQAYLVPLYTLPVFYAFSGDLVFQPSADEIPRFFNARWR